MASPSADVRSDARDSERSGRARLTADLLSRLASARTATERRRLRDELVLANRPVAEAVASRYRGRGVSEEDLRQAACEGLIKAVDRFDPELRNDLLTFAVPTIRGEVQRYFRDLGWTVRPPRRIQELQWRINRTVAELRQQLGRDPERSEVAAAVGVGTREFDEAQAAYGAFSPSSLDRPLDADGGGRSATLADLLPGQDGGFEAVETRHLLSQALGLLTAREKRIVYARFWEDRMQRDIGDELGITQMQVSRLLTQIIDKLRADLRETPHETALLAAGG